MIKDFLWRRRRDLRTQPRTRGACLQSLRHLTLPSNLVKYSAYAECEIIHFVNCEILRPSVAMWNEICPHSRQRIFHICEANISQRSYFTCPQGQISLKKAQICLGRQICAFFWKGRIKLNPQPFFRYMTERTSIFPSPYSIFTVFSMPPLKMTSSSFFDTTLMQSTSFLVMLSS